MRQSWQSSQLAWYSGNEIRAIEPPQQKSIELTKVFCLKHELTLCRRQLQTTHLIMYREKDKRFWCLRATLRTQDELSRLVLQVISPASSRCVSLKISFRFFPSTTISTRPSSTVIFLPSRYLGIISQLSSDCLLVVLTMTRQHRPPPRRSQTRSGRAPPHSGPSAGTWRCGDTLAKYNFLIICPPPTFVTQIFTFDLQPTVSLVLLAVFDKLRNLHTVSPGVVQLAPSEHQTQLFSLVYSLNSSVCRELKFF